MVGKWPILYMPKISFKGKKSYRGTIYSGELDKGYFSRIEIFEPRQEELLVLIKEIRI